MKKDSVGFLLCAWVFASLCGLVFAPICAWQMHSIWAALLVVSIAFPVVAMWVLTITTTEDLRRDFNRWMKHFNKRMDNVHVDATLNIPRRKDDPADWWKRDQEGDE